MHLAQGRHGVEFYTETKVIVDLESQSVGIEGEEWTMHFDIDPFIKVYLMKKAAGTLGAAVDD